MSGGKKGHIIESLNILSEYYCDYYSDPMIEETLSQIKETLEINDIEILLKKIRIEFEESNYHILNREIDEIIANLK